MNLFLATVALFVNLLTDLLYPSLDPMGDVSQLTPPGAEPAAGAVAAGQAGLRKFFARLVREQPLGTAGGIVILILVNVGGVIMAEAALSFLLGFGLPPDIPSWGGMLSREGRQYMEIAPHLALRPGVCLTVVFYSLNMFGDAVRDLLDPRLRGRLGRYGAGRE